MSKKTVLSLITAAMLLSACSQIVSAAGPAPSSAANEAGTDSPAANPDSSVEEFYAGYLAYIGRERGQFNNPLVDHAYRDMAGLHPEFIQSIDGLVEEGLAADPILCAQDIPQFVEASEVIQDGSKAVVTLEDSFEGHTIEASIELLNGEWLITDINCGR